MIYSSWGLGYQEDDDAIKLLDDMKTSLWDGHNYGIAIFKENNRDLSKGDTRFCHRQ